MEQVTCKGCTFLFSFFSMALNAFQNDYNSIDSTIDETLEADQYNERFLLNAPYSYCLEDGIPMALCPDLGLRLYADTFQNLNITENFNAEYRYDTSTLLTWFEELANIESKYFLPPYERGSHKVPTEGQLVWMFTNGYASKGTKGTKHWIRKAETNTFTLAVIGEGYINPNRFNTGKLHRLVTVNIPSSCEGQGCDEFKVETPTFLTMRNSENICSILGWGYQISWNLANNSYLHKASKLSSSSRAEFKIPANATNITVRMYAGSTAFSTRNNIELTDFPSIEKTTFIDGVLHQKICYYIKGNCVNYKVTPYYECW